jgi:hypothetical protein
MPAKGIQRQKGNHLTQFPITLLDTQSLFDGLLQKARTTNHKYESPKRHQVASNLLDGHYASYQENGMDVLLADVNTYGC